VVARALDALAEFTVPVFLLPGNHDPLLGAGSVWDAAAFVSRCPPLVAVLRDATPVPIAGGAAEVIGAAWPSKRPMTDLVGAVVADLQPADVPRIVVGHGAVDRGSPDPNDPALIGLDDLERAIADGRVQYVALGDRHSVTDVGTSGRVWYPGTPLVTDYTEDAPNAALIVELDLGTVTVTQVPVGDWTFVRSAVDLTGDADVEALERWLAARTDKRRCVVKLSFTGAISLADKMRLDAVLDAYADVFAGLDVWDRRTDLVVIPDDADLAEMGASGFLAAAIDDLKRIAAGGGLDGETAQDALSLLYRLTRAAS
jgi:DNA repair exonuclease SbcCD nuclease subunit